MKNAGKYIQRTQCAQGGWGYLGDDLAGPNTAATCWPLQALLLARALGWTGLESSIEGGFRHLARVTDERGRTGYRRPGEFRTTAIALSSMGAHCLLLARDVPGVPAALRGRILDAIMRASVALPAERDFYRDFFLSSALEALPASRRGRWLPGARSALLSAQVRDGRASRKLGARVMPGGRPAGASTRRRWGP